MRFLRITFFHLLKLVFEKIEFEILANYTSS